MSSSHLEESTSTRSRDSDALAKRSEAILDVAVKVFAQRGFAVTDVQEIADKAGVGKGTIYRHFESKERLFLAAAELGVRQLQAAIDAAAQQATDPLQRISAAVTAFLQFFDQHPEFVELVIQERAHFRDRETPTFFCGSPDRAQEHQWEETLRGMIRAGIVRDRPVEQIMDTLGHYCFGAIFVNYFAGRKKSLAQQAEELNDIIFHGILAPRAERAG